MITVLINIDSLRKAIIDSMALVQKQQMASIDYIAKVDSFYNSAWLKLAALFALIGVFVPLLINYLQVKRNEKDQQNMKSEISKDLKIEIDKYLKDEIRVIQHAAEGVSYHIQAEIYLNAQKYKEAFGEYVNSLTCYLIGKDYDNFMNGFEDLLKCFSKVTKESVNEIKTSCSEYYNIEELINKLEKTEDKNYKICMEKLKFELGKLT
jgi:hypothetical protein